MNNTAIFSSDSEGDGSFRKEILKIYDGKTLRSLIIECAAKQTDIHKNVELMLMLLNKWPEQIANIGPQMTEKLLNEEKKTQSALPVDDQRSLGQTFIAL